MRQEFSKPVKLAAWHRSNGRCETCSAKLFPGHIVYDHVVADGLGGAPTLENCHCICDVCHDIKTFSGAGTQHGDVTRIAKAKRGLASHVGAEDRKRSFPANRSGAWKKKINGSVERR